MPFLHRADYYGQIKKDLLQVITDGQDWLLEQAEQTAQAELSEYLRGRYDLAACFIDLQPWLATEQYNAGAVVVNGTATVGTGAQQLQVPLIYVAGEATIGQEPPAPAAPGQPAPPAGPWQLRDPRHQLLRMYLIDAALYHLHSRQNPATVPEVRRDRYDQVIAWLNLCRQGKISPGLPLLPATATDGQPNRESIRPRGGSLPKLKNAY